MKMQVSKEIFDKFPESSIGIVVATGLDNKGNNSEIFDILTEVQKKVASDFAGQAIAENPTIKAWRKVYSEFGAKKYRASIESLIRRTTKEDWLTSINNLVDLYNYISLKHILPLGGEDLDKVEGNILLTVADGSERFIPLSSTEVEHPKPGEVIYKDDNDVMCRRWNWREAEKTKLTEETTNAFLMTEGILSEEKERVETATKELAELVEKYLGGKTQIYFLDNKVSEIKLGVENGF